MSVPAEAPGDERSLDGNKLGRTRRSWDLLRGVNRGGGWRVSALSAGGEHRRSSSVDLSTQSIRRRRGIHWQQQKQQDQQQSQQQLSISFEGANREGFVGQARTASSRVFSESDDDDEYYSDSCTHLVDEEALIERAVQLVSNASQALSSENGDGDSMDQSSVCSGSKRIRDDDRYPVLPGSPIEMSTEGAHSACSRRIKQQRLDAAAMARLTASVENVSMHDRESGAEANTEGQGASSRGLRIMVDELAFPSENLNSKGGKWYECPDEHDGKECAASISDCDSEDGSRDVTCRGDVDTWLKMTDWWTL